MTVEIRHVTPEDDLIHGLTTYVMHGWPSTRAKAGKELQPCWSFRDEIAVIDGLVMKGRRSITLYFPAEKSTG